MRKEERYLSPRLLQAVGVILLVGASIYWAVTGQQSALIVSAAMGLIGLGSYAGIHISVKQEIQARAELEAEEENPLLSIDRESQRKP
jgi:hypothetical protein